MRLHWITGTLVARTAVHVGSGMANEVTDAPCRRDNQGRFVIPGFAVAGALRALATRLAPCLGYDPCLALTSADPRTSCPCIVCGLFGDIVPSAREAGAPAADASAKSSPSALWIENAYAAEGTLASVRDMVGIDRASGTAARGAAAKFDVEVLPAGIAFDLRIEMGNLGDEQRALLWAALAEWEQGRAFLGGRTARGFGAFTLDALACHTTDLDRADDLMHFLTDATCHAAARDDHQWLEESQRLALASVRRTPHAARTFAAVTLDLEATGPMLVNDASNAFATGFDYAPVTLTGWNGTPVLPGSTLRGVVRGHAERIARTVATLDATNKRDFLRHCPACDPLAARPSKNTPMPLESCDSLLRHQAKLDGNADIDVGDLCLACQLFGSPRNGSRLVVEDAPVATDKITYKLLDFVAIDRFTGGSLEHAKFDALALWQPRFRARLHLENPSKWELGWLALTFRDLADGRLALGFGGAKGFGEITIARWTVSIGFIAAEDFPGARPDGAVVPSGVYQVQHFDSEDSDAVDAALALAESWIGAWHTRLKKMDRKDNMQTSADTYFGTPCEQPYLKEEPQWLKRTEA